MNPCIFSGHSVTCAFPYLGVGEELPPLERDGTGLCRLPVDCDGRGLGGGRWSLSLMMGGGKGVWTKGEGRRGDKRESRERNNIHA